MGVTADHLMAAGTIAAAVFAGASARSSAKAADAARELALIETRRDDDRRERERWHQARRVVLDLSGRTGSGSGRDWHDLHLLILNTSDGPVTKCRVLIEVGGQSWGPQLIGSIAPRAEVVVMTRIYSVSAPDTGARATLRFRDSIGELWVADAWGGVEPDIAHTDLWVERGREWAQRSHTELERGTTWGVPVPDFDAWAEAAPE